MQSSPDQQPGSTTTAAAAEADKVLKLSTQFVSDKTDLGQLVAEQFVELPCSRLGIVGLHTCGNLAASSLRVRFYTTFLPRVFFLFIRVIVVRNLVIVTFCRVSGLSPFMGDTDLETMANVTIAEYDYEDEAFDNVSKEAKDFIDRLLVKEQP